MNIEIAIIFAMSAGMAIFFAGYLCGRIRTLKQLASIDNFKKIAEDFFRIKD